MLWITVSSINGNLLKHRGHLAHLCMHCEYQVNAQQSLNQRHRVKWEKLERMELVHATGQARMPEGRVERRGGGGQRKGVSDSAREEVMTCMQRR